MIHRLCVLGALAFVLLSRPSSAQEANQARLHFDAAVAHVDDGELVNALREFNASYDAMPRPRTLFNIVQVLESLGRLPEALEAAELLANASGITTEEMQRVEGLRRRGLSDLCRLRLRIRAEHTVVRVDGVPRRWARGEPVTLWLAPSTLRVEVEAPGLPAWVLEGPFESGQHREVQVTLGATETHRLVETHRILVSRGLIEVDGIIKRDVVVGTAVATTAGDVSAASLVQGATAITVETPTGQYPVESMSVDPASGLAIMRGAFVGATSIPSSPPAFGRRARVVTHVDGPGDQQLVAAEIAGSDPNASLVLTLAHEVHLGSAVINEAGEWVGVVVANSPQVESRDPARLRFSESHRLDSAVRTILPDGALPDAEAAPRELLAAALWNAYRAASNESAERRTARLRAIESALEAAEGEREIDAWLRAAVADELERYALIPRRYTDAPITLPARTLRVDASVAMNASQGIYGAIIDFGLAYGITDDFQIALSGYRQGLRDTLGLFAIAIFPSLDDSVAFGDPFVSARYRPLSLESFEVAVELGLTIPLSEPLALALATTFRARVGSFSLDGGLQFLSLFADPSTLVSLDVVLQPRYAPREDFYVGLEFAPQTVLQSGSFFVLSLGAEAGYIARTKRGRVDIYGTFVLPYLYLATDDGLGGRVRDSLEDVWALSVGVRAYSQL